jgi:hypothetical protein
MIIYNLYLLGKRSTGWGESPQKKDWLVRDKYEWWSLWCLFSCLLHLRVPKMWYATKWLPKLCNCYICVQKRPFGLSFTSSLKIQISSILFYDFFGTCICRDSIWILYLYLLIIKFIFSCPETQDDQPCQDWPWFNICYVIQNSYRWFYS